jgi:hypothetical protein
MGECGLCQTITVDKPIHSPRSLRIPLIISQFTTIDSSPNTNSSNSEKYSKKESLTEEAEIATNVKLNPLYIADRKDEIEFVRWTAAIINSILDRDDKQKCLQLGAAKMRLDLADCIDFENTLQSRVEELNLKLKDCNNLRESDILINEIDTLESILGRLSDLKYGDKVRAIEIAEANHDFRRALRLRKQINKI